jgi:cell division cycle protein 20 (cofactor of APC complex)
MHRTSSNYYLVLMAWESSNVLSTALDDMMYLWDASSGSTSELLTVKDDTSHHLLHTYIL